MRSARDHQQKTLQTAPSSTSTTLASPYEPPERPTHYYTILLPCSLHSFRTQIGRYRDTQRHRRGDAFHRPVTHSLTHHTVTSIRQSHRSNTPPPSLSLVSLPVSHTHVYIFKFRLIFFSQIHSCADQISTAALRTRQQSQQSNQASSNPNPILVCALHFTSKPRLQRTLYKLFFFHHISHILSCPPPFLSSSSSRQSHPVKLSNKSLHSFFS